MPTSRLEGTPHGTASRVRATVAAVALITIAPSVPRTAFAQTAVAPKTVLAAITDTLDPSRADGPRLFGPTEAGRLRPCCAFGGEMKVKVLGIPLPCYRHRPLRGAPDIGPHEYDPGVLQILPSPVAHELRRPTGGPARPKREHNGIIYACRGGFLDTAHIRDFADLTWFLAARVEERLESGGTIELRDYGGRRRVTIHPPAPERIRAAGRTVLAIAVAARLAFDLSVWREIATWYGHESVPPWSEKLSSFSPEDLYSNVLGTKLAMGILQTTDIPDRRAWDLAMTSWLDAAMQALGAVRLETARTLMASLDGTFWDSNRRIPDWQITARRRFERGPDVAPLVSPTQTCGTADPPIAIRVRDVLAGISVDQVAQIEVVVSDRLVRHGFPLPRGGDRRIGEADFDELIAAVRRATSAARASITIGAVMTPLRANVQSMSVSADGPAREP
jgi:hypothetical protein